MKTKGKRKTKWKNKFYVDIYRLAAQGLTNDQIAQAIGIGVNTFESWRHKRSTVRYAIQQGRGKDKGQTVKSFMNYVFDHLPQNLQELWLKIQAIEDEPSAVNRIERMLEKEGKYVRMHLFLSALVSFNFNPSRAMRAVNISKKVLDSWINTEPGFAELLDEMREHKKNFCEEALMKLVDKGDPNAVLFVNRTLNKDRGYAEKTVVEHTGEVKHSHDHRIILDLDKMNLSFQCRKEIVEEMRRLRTEQEKNTLEYRVKQRGIGHLEATPIPTDDHPE